MNYLKRKIVIITAILVPEALKKKDRELEAEIRAELSSRDIPWCERIKNIEVLSNSSH